MVAVEQWKGSEMSVSDVAGLIAAIAFVALVGFLAVPMIKLGRVLDETKTSIRTLTDHSVPLLTETAKTIASTNVQLGKVDTITSSAAQVSENVAALTSLFAATVGSPLVKVAAFSFGVRSAFGRRSAKRAR